MEALAAEVRGAGVDALWQALDAADGAAVSDMAARVVAYWGPPRLVVNSAGAGVWRFLEETPPEGILEMAENWKHTTDADAVTVTVGSAPSELAKV